MDISLTPDTYSPDIDSNGNYIDHSPVIKNGIYCICGSRKDKVYDSRAKFVVHTKTQRHQKWLRGMNDNKANFFVELEKSKELVNSQRKIIAGLENQLQVKIVTIDCLTQQIASTTLVRSGNLIDM